jgi:hypothetical protein
MRSRLALLVAATIVFAPGWNGHGRPEPARGGELAVRMLAPTFDEGQFREPVRDIKEQVRSGYATSPRSLPTSPGAGGFALSAVALALLWVLSVTGERLTRCIPLLSRCSRAPPLQLA